MGTPWNPESWERQTRGGEQPRPVAVVQVAATPEDRRKESAMWMLVFVAAGLMIASFTAGMVFMAFLRAADESDRAFEEWLRLQDARIEASLRMPR